MAGQHTRGFQTKDLPMLPHVEKLNTASTCCPPGCRSLSTMRSSSEMYQHYPLSQQRSKVQHCLSERRGDWTWGIGVEFYPGWCQNRMLPKVGIGSMDNQLTIINHLPVMSQFGYNPNPDHGMPGPTSRHKHRQAKMCGTAPESLVMARRI